MPANERSVNVMDSTGTNMSVAGPWVRYDSYYGYTDGFGTFQVTFDGFVGKFMIEATLVLDPSANLGNTGTDDPGFGVVPENPQGNVVNDLDTVFPNISFYDDEDESQDLFVGEEVNPNTATQSDFFVGEVATGPGGNGGNNTWYPDGSLWITVPYTGTRAYSIKGNFTHVRVRVGRSQVGDGVTYDPSFGQINRVILST
jgi:hypothetical protein